MADSSAKRLIHVSSLVVYDWSRAKRIFDESTPLQSNMYEMGAYTIAKIWQERIITKFAAANLWDLTILRPGFIWGPQNSEIAGMGRRLGRTYLMFGPFTRLPLSHVTNCSDCIAKTLESPKSIGETFNVVDSNSIRVWRYVRAHATGAGGRTWLLPVPYYGGLATARFAAFISRILFGKDGKLPSLLTPRRYKSQFKPLRFSNHKLKSVVDWKPPLSFEECVSATYA